MENKIITENWIKPPKLVTYTNSHLIAHERDSLVCEFLFPKKYYENDFYVNGEKVLNKYEMYKGKRYFYSDRFYSLLEFYSDDNKLKALYFDLSLPAIINEDSVLITDIKLDVFYLIESKKHYLLDEDEFDEAIKDNLFTIDEIDACKKNADFIIKCIEERKIENIFIKYEKTSPEKWDRYKEFLNKNS